MLLAGGILVIAGTVFIGAEAGKFIQTMAGIIVDGSACVPLMVLISLGRWQRHPMAQRALDELRVVQAENSQLKKMGTAIPMLEQRVAKLTDEVITLRSRRDNVKNLEGQVKRLSQIIEEKDAQCRDQALYIQGMRDASAMDVRVSFPNDVLPTPPSFPIPPAPPLSPSPSAPVLRNRLGMPLVSANAQSSEPDHLNGGRMTI